MNEILTQAENIGSIFDGRYKLIRPLSTDGATADVWLALDTNTIDTEYNDDDGEPEAQEDSGMMVAIKIYRPKNALDIEGEQRFRDEFKIAYDCHHANLLQPTSFSIYNGIPYLVLPYCKLGSSEQLIGKKQSNDEIWKFVLDVSSGLARLHSNQPQIVHQDIKPGNILIDSSHNFTITDFGISSQTNKLSKGYYYGENSGTIAYMAPERFEEGQPATPSSDIWAFGATLCEILTGNVPFGEDGGQGQLNGAAIKPLTGLPTSIKKLIKACLQKDPNKRPTAAEIAKAAQEKRFPTKSKLPIYIIALVATIMATYVAFLFFAKPQPDIPTPPTDPIVTQKPEEVYDIALQQLNSKDSITAHKGLHLMDSLSQRQYIPAMYEVAFTYGWYSDSLSRQRKETLGIEMDKYKMPKYVKDKTKAKDLLDGILELNDSTYASINAKAAYRMATYYGDKRIRNSVKTGDIQVVSDYLQQSEKWAKLAGDEALLNSIAEMRRRIQEQQQQKQQIKPTVHKKSYSSSKS